MDNKNFDDLNVKKWGEELGKNILMYPDERVVSFLSTYFKSAIPNHEKKALDIGFGSGRHLKLLQDYGFDIYGVDYSTEALKAAQDYFDLKESEKLKVADLADAPFSFENFDVILLYGVLFCRTIKEMQRDLYEAVKMLKKGGKMLVNFRSTNNWFFGLGEEIETSTYKLDKRAASYEDITYTFLTQKQAESLLNEQGLTVLNYELYELNKRNATEQHSWHVFWVEK